jgi:hypothetical protein
MHLEQVFKVKIELMFNIFWHGSAQAVEGLVLIGACCRWAS